MPFMMVFKARQHENRHALSAAATIGRTDQHRTNHSGNISSNPSMMKLARSKLLSLNTFKPSLNTFKPASWIIPIAISPDVRTPALSCSLTYVYVLTLFEDCAGIVTLSYRHTTGYY